MFLNIIRFTIICSVILLLLNCVICEENKTSDDYVYDYGSGASETSVERKEGDEKLTNDENNPNDDHVYDNGSGEEVKDKKDETEREERVLSDEKTSDEKTSDEKTSDEKTSDDHVYDYEEVNNTDSNTTDSDIVDIEDNISKDNKTLDSNEKSTETTVESVNTTDSSVEEDKNVDDDYESENDDAEGDQESGGGCDKTSILDKLRALHDEGKNLTVVKRVSHINETLERLNYVRNLYKKLYEPDKKTLLESLAFLSSIDVTVQPECFASLFTVFTGLRTNQLWASKFLDSSGRYSESGSSDGRISSFGDFDECLDIESPEFENKGLIVKGQYCLLKVIIPYPPVNSYNKGEPVDLSWKEESFKYFKNFKAHKVVTITRMIEGLNILDGKTFRIGVCVPALCKVHELEEILNKIVYPITRLPIEVGPICHKKDKSEDFTKLQLISMGILIILTILVITSTGIEIYNIIYERNIREENNYFGDVKFVDEDLFKVNPYYYTFSLVTNTRSLLAENKRFAALDTLRLFLILHLYVLHFYNTVASMGIVTLKRSLTTYPMLGLELDRYSTIRNSVFIDALFTMSGFIITYGLLGKLQKNNGKFSIINWIFNRWIRFSIPLLGSIIFFYILPLLGNGPIWEYGVNWVIRPCESPLVVLLGFLYLSNFNEQFGLMPRQPALPICNPSSWFISALFQLHLIVPIFIVIYYKNPKRGLYVTIGAIIVGLFLSVAPTLLFGILPKVQFLQMESFEELFQSIAWYHLATNNYVVSFLVGVLGGYLLKNDIKLNHEKEVIAWILSVLTIILVFMWNNTFWKLNKSAPLYSVLLWYSFGKLFSAAAFTWIYFALCTGRAQIMNYLLSWYNFQPFARLSFGFFMIHLMVIFRRIFTVKETVVMYDSVMIENSIIDFMVTFCLAYIFYVLIECPFSNLLTLWSKAKDKPEEQRKNGVLSKSATESTKDSGHSNEIELEENIVANKNVEIDISEVETYKL